MNLKTQPCMLMLFALAIFLLSSFKESKLVQHENIQDSISREEAISYFESNKLSVGFLPDFTLSQILQTENSTYLRVPLKECYSSLYLTKNEQNKIEGTIVRAFPIDSVLNFKRFSGAIFWQKVGQNDLIAMLFMEGNYEETINYGFKF